MFNSLGTKVKALIATLTISATVIGAVAVGPSAHAVTLSNGTTLPSSSFLKVDANGQPARWDPCAPAFWKLYKVGLPKGSIRAVVKAMRQIKAATGINFMYLGAATAAEMENPPARTIVIGFTSLLPDTRAGVARSTFVGGPNDSLVILSSQVKINRVTARRVNGKSPVMLHVLLHELGHAVGLAHSASSGDVMYHYVSRVFSFQPADLAKLDAVGVQTACQPPVA